MCLRTAFAWWLLAFGWLGTEALFPVHSSLNLPRSLQTGAFFTTATAHGIVSQGRASPPNVNIRRHTGGIASAYNRARAGGFKCYHKVGNPVARQTHEPGGWIAHGALHLSQEVRP